MTDPVADRVEEALEWRHPGHFYGQGPCLSWCGCIVDTELGAGPVCPACGHRDHGRSGCRAELRP